MKKKVALKSLLRKRCNEKEITETTREILG